MDPDWTNLFPRIGKMERDWSELLPELLALMSKKVTSMSDFIRIRAVCTKWKNRLSPPSSHLPSLLPWIVLPRGNDDGADTNLGSSLSMYDLSQSRTHILDLPEIQGKRICGSSHGWLVLEKERNVWLLNPITRDKIILPSLSLKPNSFEGNTKGVVVQCVRKFCIKKAILSSNPRVDSNCLVMALFVGSWGAAFCRIGDDCWTTVFKRSTRASRIVDIGYNNSLIYAILYSGQVRICNISNTHFNMIHSPFGDNISWPCIVHGRGDDKRLLVFACKDLIDDCRLIMLSEDKNQWLDMDQEDSASSVFFLGGYFHCLSIPTDNLQLDGWEGGSICYIDPQFVEIMEGVERYRCSIRHPNIGAKSVLGTLSTNLDLFFHPNSIASQLKSPYFLWLTPTLS